MRISLIHGEDNLASYTKYRQLIDSAKKKGFGIIPISELKEIVSQSLFEEKTVFSFSQAKKVNPSDWKWLFTNSSKYNSNLLIYFPGGAPAGVLRNLPKDVKVERFDFPKVVFQFLENIKPGNSRNLVRLLGEAVKHEPVELVFHLMGRHLRDLYWMKVARETLSIPEWRKAKLQRQADGFEREDLKILINDLAQIDIQAKVGSEDVKSLLDIWIVKHLE